MDNFENEGNTSKKKLKSINQRIWSQIDFFDRLKDISEY